MVHEFFMPSLGNGAKLWSPIEIDGAYFPHRAKKIGKID
jgi:hypothetical protein